MTKIGIILGSTRPGRNGEAVAKWVLEQSKKRTDAEFEIVDIADYNLPLLDEAYPAMMQQYSKDHTKKWSEKIKEFDGYIVVTPEYNHSTSGALKNAIDYLNVEWGDKAAGFVSYGSAGGSRAVEHLRQIFAELKVATVRAQIMFSLFTDFVNMSEFTPDARHENSAQDLFDQLISWSKALKTTRQ
ncbi:NADPH-dependent FMN reductase [Alkaliphilus metalliredigens QYMF]|uniref:NADPH-dependent FMN reductase n=1 Tax=Alkaliphilus metalliredigens (strain QYMF) TaxID=293826 RepID=A6TPM8_ALKMQ|nr:NAD(P)H-dependent oxidoreductase [Alkaliphilus metalliredigens]ABR48146.1 NADPH-dependent FMN reductase [Alkaliphilus metalliredigens QYMF]